MNIRMIPLQSSTIVDVGYDRYAKELTVQFHGGGFYTYHDVPPEVFVDLLNADSAGSFHANEIKNNFRFTRE